MVLGGQWGDEGKGKIVDLLSGGFRAVVRYNGGHNAGHTVKFGDRHFALHLIPSGIIHAETRCYMGAAMVVDPLALVEETVAGRLAISPRATLILPTHQALDAAREAARGGSAIGTTGRGIGPAYQDLAQRRALRAGLFLQPGRFRERARVLMGAHNRELTGLFGAPPVDVERALDRLTPAVEQLAPMVGAVGPALLEHEAAGRPILFEGAQGIMLDLYHGTYPFVTSSSCLPGAAAVSCGVPTRLLGPVLGIMKAYVTRVGGGPFPTELTGGVGDQLRERGTEFGTTTGRPRRCGWFDAVAARYAVRVAGVDAISLMKLDVLDDLEEIKVAVAYRTQDGSLLAEPPADVDDLDTVAPVYETVSGWQGSSVGATLEDQLPAGACAYIDLLERELGVPVAVVSTGPRRRETLVRGGSAMAARVGEVLTSAQKVTTAS